MSSHKDIILKLIDKLMKDPTPKNIIKMQKLNKLLKKYSNNKPLIIKSDNNTHFQEKCKDYYTQNNYIKFLEEEYNIRINLLISKLYVPNEPNKEKNTNNEDCEKNNEQNEEKEPFDKEKDLYLRQRINSIKIEKDLLKLLYNENIKYDCARVSMLNNQNQFGGAYNLEYKIGKYALKFKNNINNKTYAIKMMEYINRYKEQKGGSEQNIFTASIDSILKNEYRLVTNLPRYKSLSSKIEVKNCISSLDDDEDYDLSSSSKIKNDNITKIFNTPNTCIKDPMISSDEYSINKTLYELKRDTKAISTDIFMQNILDESHYKLLCDFTFFELTSLISEFIYKINNVYLEKNIHLDEDDIYLLYKGGNTTRMYIRKLYEQLNNANPGKYSKLKEILDKLKVGDWDFNIYIDYDNLYSKGYTEEEVQWIRFWSLQIVSLGLYKIKNIFSVYLKSDAGYDYVKTMNNKYYSDEYKEILENYKNKVNSLTGNDTIRDIKIDYIKCYNYKIENDKIVYDPNNDPINKYSFIIDKPSNYNNDCDKRKSTDKYTIKTITPIVNFFSNNKLNEFVPNFLQPNNLTIVYITHLDVYSFRSYMTFALFRLKFNNIVMLKVTNKDSTETSLKLKAPIEIVDVSLSLEANRLPDYKDVYMKKGIDGHFNKVQEIKYKPHNNKNDDKNIDIKIPSAEYMYYDICCMLFVNQLFVWSDKKYGKRIERINYLSIICQLIQGTSIDKLLVDYNKFLNNWKRYHEMNIKKGLDQIYILLDAGTILLEEKIIDLPEYTKKIKYTNILKEKTISKILILNKNDSNSVNFYLDKITSSYFEMIVMMRYINEEAMNITFFDYCDDHFNLAKRIDAGKRIEQITEVSGLEDLRKPETKKANYENLLKYEEKIIDIITNIIKLLEEIKSSGVSDINLDFTNIDHLF